mgnify:FL=1
MKLSEIVKNVVKPALKLEFNPTETIQILMADRYKYFSWGVSSKYNIDNKGILLKVSGHHHKAYVLITLDWNDTYTVTLINNDGSVKTELAMVYFDMLADVIDGEIEYIDAYQK